MLSHKHVRSAIGAASEKPSPSRSTGVLNNEDGWGAPPSLWWLCMKTRMGFSLLTRTGIGTAILLAATSAAYGQVVSLPSLLAEMIDRDAVAKAPAPSYSLKQASSYDRAQTDSAEPKTWHANKDHDQFIRVETNEGRKEWVLMDDAGPGAITRFWTPLKADMDNAIIRFYLDGATAPAISAKLNDLFRGCDFVPPPFAFVSWNETNLRNQMKAPRKGAGGVGGDLYLPIPFAKGCKVTLDRVPFYYVINYRMYVAGTPVETFSMTGYEAAKGALERAAEALLADPIEPAGLGKEALLAAGEELAVDLPVGPAAVRFLQVQVDPTEAPQGLRSVVLQASFDDEPTIWCPLGEFFGAGVRLNPVQDWCRTVSHDGTLASRWVMPYGKSGRLVLKNSGQTPVTVKLAVTTGPYAWDESSLHFHANWHSERDLKTRPMSDWNYLEIKGQGVYVGDTLTAFNTSKKWYGEGDERIYIDGERFPSHLGTGTEDYYGFAWGMAGYFSSPFISEPKRDGDMGESNWDMASLTWAGYTTTSRVRLLDAIPFRTALKLDMEIWHSADCREDYAVGTFWYARPGATHNRLPQPGDAGSPLRAIP